MSSPAVWAARARRDHLSIVAYLNERSPQAAAAFDDAVSRSIERLRLFPESGRRLPEKLESAPELRELIVGEYRLVYVHRQARVKIAAIFHGRRKFDTGLLH